MKFSTKSIIFIIINTFLCVNVFAQNLTREQYIDKYKHLAIEQMNLYGIPASIILAQACLESGNGNSRLAVKGNNHFGIKCNNNWKGKTIHHNDDKRNECFRKYDKAEDSFKDHSEFLKNGKRYQSLFSLNKTDYKAWAHGLKAAGYATNPKYAQLLIEIIERNQLYKYDISELSAKESKKLAKEQAAIEKQNKKARKAALKAEKRAAKQAKKASNPTTVIAPAATTTTVETAILLKESPLYKYSLSRQIYTENGTPYIIATGNETYNSISKEYNLFKRELLRFNGLTKEQPITAGTKIYIGKKR